MVLSGFGVGCMLSFKLFHRRDFLKSFLVFLSSLATNIRYDSSDIFTLVSRSADQSRLCCLAENQNSIQPFSIQWKKNIKLLPKSLSLDSTDYNLLYEFGQTLGKADVDGELAHIELYKTSFQRQLDNAEENIKTKSKLYKAMGFFIGAAVAIMII